MEKLPESAEIVDRFLLRNGVVKGYTLIMDNIFDWAKSISAYGFSINYGQGKMTDHDIVSRFLSDSLIANSVGKPK